jgi:hypothetical protein
LGSRYNWCSHWGDELAVHQVGVMYREMGEMGEMGEGSRSEVRGFRNFELRTSNYGSRLSRISRTRESAGERSRFPLEAILFILLRRLLG